jgi:hypothetical protein
LLTAGERSEGFRRDEGDSRKSGQTGTLQKMIVESGSVTMDLDLNRLNGIGSHGKTDTLQFAVAANSFFPFWFSMSFCVVLSRDRWHLIQSGSTLPATVYPAVLGASLKQLAIEKLSSGRSLRFGRTRRQDGIHVLHHRRTPVRLRC